MSTTAATQYVKESDGKLWSQELAWASDEGFTGRFNPEPAISVPKGAASLCLEDLEWTPCTSGESAVGAWIAGLDS